MTFSIAARCADTGMFGIAVCSSSPAVAARCAYARAGVGAVASQNITDPTLGPRCLDLMEKGASATQAMEILRENTDHMDYRQVTAIDAQGRTAAFSGAHTLGRNATHPGPDVVCAGNLLSRGDIPEFMVQAFHDSAGPLGDRLLIAMDAAMTAGGEEGPVHSAGLLLVDKVSWPVASLRVDWDEGGDPIGRLNDLWGLYAPQMEDYVTRALDPSRAPSYGVPGEI